MFRKIMITGLHSHTVLYTAVRWEQWEVTMIIYGMIICLSQLIYEGMVQNEHPERAKSESDLALHLASKQNSQLVCSRTATI